jgi:hypothetical protein
MKPIRSFSSIAVNQMITSARRPQGLSSHGPKEHEYAEPG